ncbi:MAG TPA: hypothetical protein VK921_09245 [Anditalea sp.]|nr:hypothetical protein [Anditalea sp.]
MKSQTIKSYVLNLCIMVIMMVSLSSCEIIGTIFEGGIIIGIIIAVVVIGIIFWLFRKMSR